MYYVWYISYMTYTSTVTSKGTITLPAPIRRKLGITEGHKVTFHVRGKTVSVRPESGWNEFFANMSNLQVANKIKRQAPTTSREREATAAHGRRLGY